MSTSCSFLLEICAVIWETTKLADKQPQKKKKNAEKTPFKKKYFSKTILEMFCFVTLPMIILTKERLKHACLKMFKLQAC